MDVDITDLRIKFQRRIASILSPDRPKNEDDSIERIVTDMLAYVGLTGFTNEVSSGILVDLVGHETGKSGGAHGDDNRKTGVNSPWYPNYFLFMRKLFQSCGDYACFDHVCHNFLREYLFNTNNAKLSEAEELLSIPQFAKMIFQNYEKDSKKLHINPYILGDDPRDYPEEFETLMQQKYACYKSSAIIESFSAPCREWKAKNQDNDAIGLDLDQFVADALGLIISLSTNQAKRDGLTELVDTHLSKHISKTTHDLVCALLTAIDNNYPNSQLTGNMLFNPCKDSSTRKNLLVDLYNVWHSTEPATALKF